MIPYGIDAGMFRPDREAGEQLLRELGIAPGRPVLMWVSRMVYKKGLTVLLNAMPAVLRRHPELCLVLGGYGDLREELQRQAAILGIAAHVLFPGPVSRERINAFWNAGDVVVVPAIHDHRGNVDGLPNIVLEAMSAGRPIVASHIAGIPAVIDNDIHGLLVPEGDAAALAASIVRLLDDAPFAAELGRNARRRVERQLLWKHIAARFEAAYERAAGDRVTG